MADPKRPRGRPPSPKGAKRRAEVQRAYRERRKAAGKVVVTIDTWTTPTPAEIAELQERLRNALLQLELRQQDVARLEQRAASAETELRRVEQHNLNLIKDVIVLKKQLAEIQPKRRGRHAKASDIP
jgi:chromosome segregation ATPase